MKGRTQKDSPITYRLGVSSMALNYILSLMINEVYHPSDHFISSSTEDREPLNDDSFSENSSVLFIVDRGYISKSLFEKIFIGDIHLITELKKNIKSAPIHIHDIILLRKRSIVQISMTS